MSHQFLKIINPNNVPGGILNNLDELEHGALFNSHTNSNMLINLNSISNILIKENSKSRALNAHDVILWTDKVCFTWTFVGLNHANAFFERICDQLPLTTVGAAKLRGFN